MTRFLYKIIFIPVLVFVSGFNPFSSLLAQIHPAAVKKELSTYLKEYQKNKMIPGVSAGVARDGEIFWMDVSGLADAENNSPVTIKTHFRIASVSKSITAVAVMQLVEKGKIKLDADARTYIPYFPRKKWKFTVRQLLNHTAGIRNYYKGEFDDKNHYATLKDAVGIVSKDSLDYQPGTKYLYTTLGYNLLGSIIENVSGQSFDNYLSKNIFEPAEMSSTSLDYQVRVVNNRARLYTRNKYRILENAPLADLSNKYPGGGLISTSEDLLKFSIHLLSGKLIKPETLDSMLVPARLKNGTRINYGLGFTLGSDNSGRKYFAHEGYDGTSLLVIYPAEKLAVIDLLNIRDRNNGNPALDLASIVLDDKMIYPKAQLSDRLMDIFVPAGIDSAISKFRELEKDSSDTFDISLNEIAVFGYDLLGINKTIDAIKYFRFMVNRFPDKAKPYIGLADAYYRDGNNGLALRYYRMAFRIEGTNVYALSMIRKITKTK
jgi:serine beta-lactamase-like protein LACTB